MNIRQIPILFSTMMVQAILRLIRPKLVTRRTSGLSEVNVNPDAWQLDGDLFVDDKGKLRQRFKNEVGGEQIVKCPYGQPGDILWVRESFYAWGRWRLTGKLTDTGKPEKEFIDETNLAGNYCFIDNLPVDIVKGQPLDVCGWYKRPSMFMPFDACRIWLKIKNIRLERLHDITEEQAAAEGVELHKEGRHWLDYEKQAGKVTQAIYCLRTSVESFGSLWRLINGRDSFFSNPWVWVIEFERTEKQKEV